MQLHHSVLNTQILNSADAGRDALPVETIAKRGRDQNKPSFVA